MEVSYDDAEGINAANAENMIVEETGVQRDQVPLESSDVDMTEGTDENELETEIKDDYGPVSDPIECFNILGYCVLNPSNRDVLNRIQLRSNDFYLPLVDHRVKITKSNKADQILLICALWYDGLVDLGSDQLTIGVKKFVPFRRDKYIHRQCCVALRGLEVFSHLFPGKNAMANAENLLSGDRHALKLAQLKAKDDSQALLRNISLLKTILYDCGMNFVDFNLVLADWRGISSELQKKNLGKFGYLKLLDVIEKLPRPASDREKVAALRSNFMSSIKSDPELKQKNAEASKKYILKFINENN